MTRQLFDSRKCQLGEGPLWHPRRNQLFWFDIIGKRLLSQHNGKALEWQFDEHVSAAGWVDEYRVLIASETGLYRFDIKTGARELVSSLEADRPETRSNDGRADPWGGFWIGTMGKSAEAEAGAIYRFYNGKITELFNGLTIPNAICFTPDRKHAYFTDTVTRQIMRQNLDSEGWPEGPPSVFIDLIAEGLNPDGAVVDSEGCLWNAQWGASRVARYSAEGSFLSEIGLPAKQISCPAFGGEDGRTLYATSAAEGLFGESEGQTFSCEQAASGQIEHQIRL